MFEIRIEDGKKIMRIPDGVHYITEPICIEEDDLYIKGEGNAVLRAALLLAENAWEDAGCGRFCTQVSQVPDALYLNGEKYRMARYPKYNPDIAVFNGYSADCISKEKAAGWKNPKGGYIHALHKHDWGGFSYQITGKDDDGNLTYIGGWQNNRQMGMHDEYRFVENIFEELTEPGEWYYSEDERKIYVIPREGHDLSSAEIAVNSCFFSLKDRRNVVIENIRFEKSSRTFMLTKEPLLRSDWTIYRGGAVYFRDCKACRIEVCVFDDIGSNAVFADGNCEGVLVRNSLIQNIGASGVCFVGRSDCVRSPLFEYNETNSLEELDLIPGPKSDNYPKNCGVDNCIISKVGMTEKQATGVEISMAYRISVTNCSIYETSRAGLNISEGTFGGHRIEGCDVFDTVKETGDHGSFNSWGRDRFWHLKGLDDKDAGKYALLDCIEPVVIANNRFRCDRGWDIDLDDGSSNYVIFNNLCLNGGIKLREGFFRKVFNNITVNSSIHMHAWYPDSGDVVRNNLIFTPYQTYAMPEEKWGECIDGNYLFGGDRIPVQAEELSSMSGGDRNSVKVWVDFVDEASGDYRVKEPKLSGFENFEMDFGVKYPPLRKLRKEPVMPEIKTIQQEAYESRQIHSIEVKNIDTDGEMSVYGTAGHCGVIVLSVDKDSEADRKGLCKGDVIVSCGGRKVDGMADFEGCQNVYENEMGVIRGQKLIWL